MRLQHHQCRDCEQNHGVRRYAVPKGLHPFFFSGNGIGKVEHHRQLCDLGGLELQRRIRKPQPTGGVISGQGKGVMGDDDQHQQHGGQI
ncbi:hypothetical protein SDC9_135203 [bioreactor metagenome]|uniref:Uncharacterized protein n=1 Tax=bioreactor metagenome TaxID=1076179 RepID=A0A645DHN2_9ZZZZ